MKSLPLNKLIPQMKKINENSWDMINSYNRLMVGYSNWLGRVYSTYWPDAHEAPGIYVFCNECCKVVHLTKYNEKCDNCQTRYTVHCRKHHKFEKEIHDYETRDWKLFTLYLYIDGVSFGLQVPINCHVRLMLRLFLYEYFHGPGKIVEFDVWDDFLFYKDAIEFTKDIDIGLYMVYNIRTKQECKHDMGVASSFCNGDFLEIVSIKNKRY
jgi:hypothetical protein